MVDQLIAMSVDEARAFLSDNTHVVALTAESKEETDIARAVRDYGVDAGLGVLTAVAFWQRHGTDATIKMALKLYHEVANEIGGKRGDSLRGRIRQLEFDCSWAVRFSAERPWHFGPAWENANQKAGVANVMLGLAAKDLIDGGGTTSLIAANGIVNFIKRK